MSTTEVLLDGFRFTEGARWHDGALWFSDLYEPAVYRMVPGRPAEKVAVVDQPSGLGWLPDGRLLVVSMVERRIMRVEHDGTVVVHAELSHLAPFHVNDMYVTPEGRAYVSQYGFDFLAYIDDHGVEALFGEPAPPMARIIKVEPDGTAVETGEPLRMPNGIVPVGGGRTLVVAETFGRRLSAFDVDEDGGLVGRRIHAVLPDIAPDGMCLDEDDHVWVADGAGCRVLRVAPDGSVVATIETRHLSMSCALGGPDRRTLFVCTSGAATPDEARTGQAARIEAVDLVAVS